MVETCDIRIIPRNNQRLGSAFDVTRLSLLCQVGDDVICPCKICGDCQSTSQDPFIQSTLCLTISTPICTGNLCILSRSNAFFYFHIMYCESFSLNWWGSGVFGYGKLLALVSHSCLSDMCLHVHEISCFNYV